MIHKDDFKNEYIFLRNNELYPEIAVSYHQVNNNIYGWYSGLNENKEIINSFFWIELDEIYYNAIKILVSKNSSYWEKNLIKKETLSEYKITRPQLKILEECEKKFKEEWFDSENKLKKIRIPRLLSTNENDKMLIPENLNFPLLSMLSNFWDLDRKIEITFESNQI